MTGRDAPSDITLKRSGVLVSLKWTLAMPGQSKAPSRLALRKDVHVDRVHSGPSPGIVSRMGTVSTLMSTSAAG
jgi:hypothetical protein